jgi:hypothetical protein
VTPAHTNAPLVPSAFGHNNGIAPKLPIVSQNAPKVAVIPQNINTIFSQVDNVPQTAPQVSILPEVSYSNSPQWPIISQNSQVPLVPENVRTNIPQVSVVSPNVPLVTIVPEFHYANSPNVPIVTQNSQVLVDPVNNVPANVPHEHAPSVPVDSPVNSPQIPLVSANGLQDPPIPAKLQNPADYIPQTDSTVLSIPVIPQNEVSDIVSRNVPKDAVIVATNVNSQQSSKISQNPSDSSEKTFIHSQCRSIIKEKSGANYPTLNFKNILNPPENIQEYYNTASDELNKFRFFRCHNKNEIGYVSSPDRLAYHCHSDEIPVKLLVEVPRGLQVGQIVDVELDAPYSAMAVNAVSGNYGGVQKNSFLEDLLTPCSYGVAVLKPEGFANRVIYLPVSVPDGKFIIHYL